MYESGLRERSKRRLSKWPNCDATRACERPSKSSTSGGIWWLAHGLLWPLNPEQLWEDVSRATAFLRRSAMS